YVHNAGAATTLGPFLDMPVETMRDLVARNVIAVMEACSNFGRPMRIRGRGGIVLMGSGAGLGGQPGLAVYSGVKGFMLNLAESLWSELRHAGVDVVGIAAPMMDTPTLRRSLGDTKMTGIYDPAEVVRTALLHLGNGPSYVYALDPSEQVFERETAARKERVLAVERVSAALLGGD
ncbi:MAG: SDR family NAD(P)-dependent oxidoreductase, partial [Alphaproteobacteria bacterium]|nr:SDR family NAD(P)-dependent oxidoreductase [Alphaproteobacteria bacterium]